MLRRFVKTHGPSFLDAHDRRLHHAIAQQDGRLLLLATLARLHHTPQMATTVGHVNDAKHATSNGRASRTTHVHSMKAANRVPCA